MKILSKAIKIKIRFGAEKSPGEQENRLLVVQLGQMRSWVLHHGDRTFS